MILEKSFTELITIPFVQMLMASEKEGVDHESFLGIAKGYRDVFSMAYKQLDEGERLEDLPKDEKIKLWEASLKNCPEDRLGWCKSVHFYRMVIKN